MVVMMNHTNILIRASYLFLATFLVEGYLGVNWGRMATQRMIPSMVVDVLLQNNISEVKLFSASDNVLEAFAGSNINVGITMPNSELKNMNATHYVNDWINVNIVPFLKLNVPFRYVFVGTTPLSKSLNPIYNESVTVMDLMQKGLESNNITGVKTTTSHYQDILNAPLTKPSMAEFKPELKEQLFNYCSILKRSNAPFGLDIFPILFVKEHFNNDMEFAFFNNNSTSKFIDGKFTYSNAFEVAYDSVSCAMEKLGFPDLPLIVGAIGWPTDGIKGGNLQNAERFHQGLANFIKSQQGTPRRPGNIDVYIHNIADETAAGIKYGPFMRHFGIYRFDGQPKFNLDFEGYAKNVLPASAVGITHMPKRWCILDVSRINLDDQIPFETLDRYINSTCEKADCTAMSPGGSCSSLPFPLNYSYGFNIGFQSNRQRIQKTNSCDYGGYGVVVPDDPSTPNCIFPVEIIAAETTNFLGQNPS